MRMGVVSGVCAWLVGASITLVNASAASAQSEKRVLLLGLGGNASEETRAQLAVAAHDGLRDVAPAPLSCQDCSRLYSMLVQLGEDPADCDAGKLSNNGLVLLKPRYVLSGEVMHVADMHYVTVRLVSDRGQLLQTITAQHSHLGPLEMQLRGDVAAAAAQQLVNDGFLRQMPAGLKPLARSPRASAPPPPAKTQPAPAPPPPAATRSAAAAPAVSRPIRVGLVVTERPARAKEFKWAASESLVLADVQQLLHKHGAEPVDVAPLIGASAAALKQDGAVGISLAERLFADTRLQQGIALRLTFSDGGRSADGMQQLHVALTSTVYPLPLRKDRIVDRAGRELTVACPDGDRAPCRRAIMAVIEEVLSTQVRANRASE